MEVYRKTRKAWNVPFHAHALTFSVRHRLPWLALPGAAEAFLSCLDRARHDSGFDLWAYVVLPEHVHVVLHPAAEVYRMEEIASAIKTPSAKEILRLYPDLREECRRVRKGRRDEFAFWQVGGGYDRNLFSAREAWEKIHYAHDNPVRRGLVEDPCDYPWSSLPAYRGQHPSIPVDPCDWEA